jgi:hypothetical protein
MLTMLRIITDMEIRDMIRLHGKIVPKERLMQLVVARMPILRSSGRRSGVVALSLRVGPMHGKGSRIPSLHPGSAIVLRPHGTVITERAEVIGYGRVVGHFLACGG